ncbi:MAG: 3-oxoacyl-[acyl-carrier-protein] synthase III C-terminal domain-containing protein [Bdellovibrionia bacterium]
MDQPRYVLHSFRSVLPPTQKPQEQALDWLATAHSRAESLISPDSPLADRERMKKLFHRFGCKPSQVAQRYSVHQDFTHLDFDQMEIFHLSRNPKGAGASTRTGIFSRVVSEVFDRFYREDSVPPQALFHVTCTGYDSPSGAERVVSRRGWGHQTEVYHLYHMGCYAAIPAVRIACGLSRPRVDIVHTELCSLHLDPSQHAPEQMVIQSLFADGLIRYTIEQRQMETTSESLPGDPSYGLEFVTSRKELLSNSEDAMTWRAGDHGLEMTLSREVPNLIAQNLLPYLKRLGSYDHNTIFAIHPGGPRILDQIQEMLELKDSQVAASRKVLLERGNMSSATLPHIWKEILEDPSVAENTQIVSLAFGPGLTLCGNVLRKISL